MKKTIATTALAIASMVCFAQKTFNDANAEKRNVSGYHAISVSGGIDLYVSPGEESVAVSASETKYRDNIRTEVENGVLKIWYEHKSGLNMDWGSNRKMKAYVSYKMLDQLIGSGGSDITVDGSIQSNALEIRVSGGSDFKGKVNVSDLKVVASGGSDVDIAGQSKTTTINANGGSDFKGYELSIDSGSVEASGGSDIYITVQKEMTARASGGSDVYYRGNGTVNEVKSSGSSSVKKTGK